MKTRSLDRQETIVKVEPNHSSPTHPSQLPRSRSSVFKFSLLSADFTLSFYTTLIRLLASCAIPNTTQDTGRNYGNNKYSSDHILPFLQSLVSMETLKELLSLPLNKDGMSPNHKEALLMFVHRVYSVTEPELLLNLITDVFLNDINTTLSVLQVTICYSILINLFINSSVFINLIQLFSFVYRFQMRNTQWCIISAIYVNMSYHFWRTILITFLVLLINYQYC